MEYISKCSCELSVKSLVLEFRSVGLGYISRIPSSLLFFLFSFFPSLPFCFCRGSIAEIARYWRVSGFGAPLLGWVVQGRRLDLSGPCLERIGFGAPESMWESSWLGVGGSAMSQGGTGYLPCRCSCELEVSQHHAQQ